MESWELRWLTGRGAAGRRARSSKVFDAFETTGAERFHIQVMINILYIRRIDTFEMHQIFDPTHPRLFRERWVPSTLLITLQHFF
jgi:hypothetical protein